MSAGSALPLAGCTTRPLPFACRHRNVHYSALLHTRVAAATTPGRVCAQLSTRTVHKQAAGAGAARYWCCTLRCSSRPTCCSNALRPSPRHSSTPLAARTSTHADTQQCRKHAACSAHRFSQLHCWCRTPHYAAHCATYMGCITAHMLLEGFELVSQAQLHTLGCPECTTCRAVLKHAACYAHHCSKLHCWCCRPLYPVHHHDCTVQCMITLHNCCWQPTCSSKALKPSPRHSSTPLAAQTSIHADTQQCRKRAACSAHRFAQLHCWCRTSHYAAHCATLMGCITAHLLLEGLEPVSQAQLHTLGC
jgi:hypothetical protein